MAVREIMTVRANQRETEADFAAPERRLRSYQFRPSHRTFETGRIVAGRVAVPPGKQFSDGLKDGSDLWRVGACQGECRRKVLNERMARWPDLSRLAANTIHRR